jgi:hypothetical protein
MRLSFVLYAPELKAAATAMPDTLIGDQIVLNL